MSCFCCVKKLCMDKDIIDSDSDSEDIDILLELDLVE